jgi:hypothetical protein
MTEESNPYSDVIADLSNHVLKFIHESKGCVDEKCVVTIASFEIFSTGNVFRVIAKHQTDTSVDVPWEMVSMQDGNISRWLNNYHPNVVIVQEPDPEPPLLEFEDFEDIVE